MDWKAEREVSEYCGLVFMNSGTQTSHVGEDLYNAYIWYRSCSQNIKRKLLFISEKTTQFFNGQKLKHISR